MFRKITSRAFLTVGLIVVLSSFGSKAPAETLTGTSVESRLTIALAVDGADLQPWLPDGWVAVPFPGGPLAGANLVLVFADQHSQLDAEGKPKDPLAKRFAVFAGLGKQSDGDSVRFYAYRVYSSDMTEDPYGNASLASVSRSMTMEANAEGESRRSEAWTIFPSDDEGALSVTLDFLGGRKNWAPSKSNPFSNQIEGFNRIYRYNQLVDLAMSKPVGKPLAGEINLASDIPELTEILDGSEELVAILDIPVFVREIFLP